jgi:hypothetical protein
MPNALRNSPAPTIPTVCVTPIRVTSSDMVLSLLIVHTSSVATIHCCSVSMKIGKYFEVYMYYSSTRQHVKCDCMIAA